MTAPRLAEILRHTHSGDPWHGSSLEAIVKDVTPQEAVARPIAGAHSILELVLHLSAWAGEVAARVDGRAPAEPHEGDWPDTAGVSWTEARDRLARAHGRLLESLARVSETRLAERVGGERDAPLGSGVTVERMVLGLAEHDAYHGGQIALLKRALRG